MRYVRKAFMTVLHRPHYRMFIFANSQPQFDKLERSPGTPDFFPMRMNYEQFN